tara:strand:- start:766 stop:942 length:177 start_codon:yes stop_codon:yes gene_type:complete
MLLVLILQISALTLLSHTDKLDLKMGLSVVIIGFLWNYIRIFIRNRRVYYSLKKLAGE